EVEAATDQLLVRQVGAGEHLRVRPERRQLDGQPGAPIRLRDLRIQPVEQRGRVVGEGDRRSQLFEVDGRLQVGRAVVAVDEARNVLMEAGGQEEVVAGDRVRDRDAPLPTD